MGRVPPGSCVVTLLFDILPVLPDGLDVHPLQVCSPIFTVLVCLWRGLVPAFAVWPPVSAWAFGVWGSFPFWGRFQCSLYLRVFQDSGPVDCSAHFPAVTFYLIWSCDLLCLPLCLAAHTLRGSVAPSLLSCAYNISLLPSCPRTLALGSCPLSLRHPACWPMLPFAFGCRVLPRRGLTWLFARHAPLPRPGLPCLCPPSCVWVGLAPSMSLGGFRSTLGYCLLRVCFCHIYFWQLMFSVVLGFLPSPLSCTGLPVLMHMFFVGLALCALCHSVRVFCMLPWPLPCLACLSLRCLCGYCASGLLPSGKVVGLFSFRNPISFSALRLSASLFLAFRW